MTTTDMIQALPLLAVVTLWALAVRWRRRRVPDWGEVAQVVLARDADGASIVPVSQLIHRRFLRSITNGATPQLRLTSTALGFTVFRPAELPFAALTRVEAQKSLMHGTCLTFIGGGARLLAMIPDRAVARAVLRLLPPGLPLSPAAAALRGPIRD